jgi:putative (di)nucleoside polyphosphate hydrolase
VSDKPYRNNVGVALFNGRGQVFIGRTKNAGPEVMGQGRDWQMPQGGIDEQEDIVAAAARELWEETSVRSVALLGVTTEWWHYDFPPYFGPWHKLSGFRGQRQRWVAFRFTGTDSEVDIASPASGEPQEFFDWRWESLARTTDYVPLFKREVYLKVVDAFGHLAIVSEQ